MFLGPQTFGNSPYSSTDLKEVSVRSIHWDFHLSASKGSA